MSKLLFELISERHAQCPNAEALRYKQQSLTYSELGDLSLSAAALFSKLRLGANERVAVYTHKCPEAVASFFAATQAGGVFVPVNPLLKSPQVSYILQNCNVRILVTTKNRAQQLKEIFDQCHDLHTIVQIDANTNDELVAIEGKQCVSWSECKNLNAPSFPNRIDADMAAILYTSGSTGRPKGVVLSHKNMVTGAHSVANYLKNKSNDRLLAVLPFSFDYGFSQLSSAFSVGASVVLLDYLLPRDVVKAIDKHQVTGLAGVPPLWNQLADLEWTQGAINSLRYMTNSGGAMPTSTLQKLRTALPNSQFYLMYGLTEAFRSTYLPPDEIDKRPDSMGKAIPNAEILVVREDGTPCAPGEPGELVHRGSLVAMGYWDDPEKTAERFKPAPNQINELPVPEIAVWSGDTVKADEEGYLYFVGRKDDMIKTSGYRVSPTEVEEIIYSSGLVGENVALGIPHGKLGQAILVVATPNKAGELSEEAVINHCKQNLPNFMIPLAVQHRSDLPRNANGKIDRKSLSLEYQDIFSEQ